MLKRLCEPKTTWHVAVKVLGDALIREGLEVPMFGRNGAVFGYKALEDPESRLFGREALDFLIIVLGLKPIRIPSKVLPQSDVIPKILAIGIDGWRWGKHAEYLDVDYHRAHDFKPPDRTIFKAAERALSDLMKQNICFRPASVT